MWGFKIMIYGYARVSTVEQSLNLQTDALKAAGCKDIFLEKVSANMNRPELTKLISTLKKGDTIVVWKLDRLGRSLRNLIDLVKSFDDLQVKFISLNDSIDTSTATGRLIFNIFASLAEFEREVIKERTSAGLAAARARGIIGGRRKGLTAEAQVQARFAQKLYTEGELTIAEILVRTRIKSRRTLYNYIRTDFSEFDIIESKSNKKKI